MSTQEDKQNIDTKLIFDSLRFIPAASIGLGFIFTASYFMDISYFPQNDINSYISIFIYISTLCFLIVGMIPLLSLCAIVLWVRNIFGNPKVSRWLIKPEDMEIACNISIYSTTNESTHTERIIHKIQLYYAVSTIIFSIAIFLTLQYTHEPAKTTYTLVATAVTITLISFFRSPTFVWNSKKRNPDIVKNHTSKAIEASKTKFDMALFLLEYIGNTIASSLILYLSIYLVQLISPFNDILYAALIGGIVIIFSTTWLTYITEHRGGPKAYLIFFIIFSITILSFTHEKLITSALKNSKLGSFDARIFVDYETCSIFRNLGKEVTCKKNGLTQIDKVNIKWRGTDQYITFKTSSKNNKENQHYIILPSSAIKGTGN